MLIPLQSCLLTPDLQQQPRGNQRISQGCKLDTHGLGGEIGEQAVFSQLFADMDTGKVRYQHSCSNHHVLCMGSV